MIVIDELGMLGRVNHRVGRVGAGASRLPAPAWIFALTAGLTGLWLLGPAAATSRSHPGDDAGPVQLKRVAVSQDTWRLRLAVGTHGRWDAAALTDRPRRIAEQPQSYICVDLRQRKRLSRVCIGRREGQSAHLTWMRVGERGGIGSVRRLGRARVQRGNRRSLRATVPFRALGLRPGRVRWRWRSSWARGACAPADAGDRQGERRREEGLDCTDLRPRQGFNSLRLRKPRRIGCTRAPRRMYRSGSRGSRRVALTFDDGPSSYTSAVIRTLNRHNAKGTFFVVGGVVSGRGSVLRTMLRSGHEIGNHSTSHRAGPSRSDLARTNSIIRGATGFSPCVFRPPYGIASGGTVSAAWSLGMSTILWDVDTNDWRRPGSGAIYSRAVGGTRPGSIVLMHDGGGNRSQTVAALPRIVRTLRSRGYRLVTVTRLLGQRFRWR